MRAPHLERAILKEASDRGGPPELRLRARNWSLRRMPRKRELAGAAQIIDLWLDTSTSTV
jgi:hypothetical protein